MAIGTVGLRWEAMPGRFLTGRAAAGRDDASGRVRAGLAVSAGADSVLGPVELTLMAPTDLSPIRLQFALGHRF